jgi:hypothetical protein
VVFLSVSESVHVLSVNESVHVLSVSESVHVLSVSESVHVLSVSESVHVLLLLMKRKYCVYISIVVADPIIMRGEGWNLINWFNPTKWLCLSQART